MSGGGAQKRSRLIAVRCAKMDEEGMPHQQIADAVGIRVEQVKARIVLGKRLLSLGEENWRDWDGSLGL